MKSLCDKLCYPMLVLALLVAMAGTLAVQFAPHKCAKCNFNCECSPKCQCPQAAKE